jgi:pimeloyl-ACP methyl ester carboxylesterase
VPEVLVNGVTLYYEERGVGAPILGIHGGGSSAAFWVEAAAELGKRGRAIVYDRRGSFRSERPSRTRPTSTSRRTTPPG